MTVVYATRVRWDKVAYAVSRNGQVVGEGRLRGSRSSFALPDAPGIYDVSIRYRWDGGLAQGYAEGIDYFRVEVQP